jgi:hypothetical protein
MKLRTGDPFMPAPQYGRALSGLSINLLVRETDKAVLFQHEVLGAAVVYHDPDFAVLEWQGTQWMVHADHAYERHPIRGLIAGVAGRGAGLELRLHGCDPDRAEAQARRLGFIVLAPAVDKGHGLREAFLVDADGYVWVPDVHTKEVSS